VHLVAERSFDDDVTFMCSRFVRSNGGYCTRARLAEAYMWARPLSAPEVRIVFTIGHLLVVTKCALLHQGPFGRSLHVGQTPLRTRGQDMGPEAVDSGA
jgi:hypothetical protein